ncbi:hypothetical protein ACT2FY_40865 [Paraburkholderia fungorum]|uniref:hypothetical protein n=1 Tax=Paraburkholderia fungorum TaxID=134537 RepID=UPI00402BE660
MPSFTRPEVGSALILNTACASPRRQDIRVALDEIERVSAKIPLIRHLQLRGRFSRRIGYEGF